MDLCDYWVVGIEDGVDGVVVVVFFDVGGDVYELFVSV